MESNIVRVKVIEPPPEQREALALLSDPQLASFVEGDLRTGLVEDVEVEAGAEKALVFLEKHGRSLYAAMVEDQLRAVLTEAEQRGELTPKLQTLKTLLPDK